jgi:hypothetical protein
MAIKVNGTTVINDSRALSNIASVDATTAAAIGNAGVGGASTLISDSVSVGTGATFSVSFSGSYRAYRLLLDGVDSNINYAYLRWRYTDGSGTAITSQAYSNHYENKGSGRTWWLDTFFGVNEYYHQGGSDRAYVDMYIYNPNSTTEVTWHRGTYAFDADFYNQGDLGGQISKHTYGIGANSSIYFYNDNNGNFDGGTYSLWGIN